MTKLSADIFLKAINVVFATRGAFLPTIIVFGIIDITLSSNKSLEVQVSTKANFWAYFAAVPKPII